MTGVPEKTAGGGVAIFDATMDGRSLSDYDNNDKTTDSKSQMKTMYQPKKHEKKQNKTTTPSHIIFTFLKTIEIEKHHRGSKGERPGTHRRQK